MDNEPKFLQEVNEPLVALEEQKETKNKKKKKKKEN